MGRGKLSLNLGPTIPKGPDGQKRPADAIGRAVIIGKIVSDMIDDTIEKLLSAAAGMGRAGGQKRA
jgi:hypothetical protein